MAARDNEGIKKRLRRNDKPDANKFKYENDVLEDDDPQPSKSYEGRIPPKSTLNFQQIPRIYGKPGHVVIINQKKRVRRNGRTICKKRKGSQKDVDQLQNVFGNILGFGVEEPLEDLKHKEIFDKIEDLKANKKLLKEINCLIFIYMSHGNKNDTLCAVDTNFNLYDLVDSFTPDKVPELAGKPKIFIIQACRGEKADKGYDARDMQCISAPIYKYPLFSDILIAFSSHRGFCSFRDEVDGSWFIQEFCNAIQAYHEKASLDKTNILDILMATNMMVCQRSSISEDVDYHDKKQTAAIYFTLTKNVYLVEEPKKESKEETAITLKKSNTERDQIYVDATCSNVLESDGTVTVHKRIRVELR